MARQQRQQHIMEEQAANPLGMLHSHPSGWAAAATAAGGVPQRQQQPWDAPPPESTLETPPPYSGQLAGALDGGGAASKSDSGPASDGRSSKAREAAAVNGKAREGDSKRATMSAAVSFSGISEMHSTQKFSLQPTLADPSFVPGPEHSRDGKSVPRYVLQPASDHTMALRDEGGGGGGEYVCG